jgi:hypothetical protein
MPRQRPSFQPALRVELAKLRHRLLDDTTTDTHAAQQWALLSVLTVV